jgi:hypothetical protein
MNPRIFIASMAVGHDYLLILNMLGVFLVSVILAVAVTQSIKYGRLFRRGCWQGVVVRADASSRI